MVPLCNDHFTILENGLPFPVHLFCPDLLPLSAGFTCHQWHHHTTKAYFIVGHCDSIQRNMWSLIGSLTHVIDLGSIALNFKSLLFFSVASPNEQSDWLGKFMISSCSLPALWLAIIICIIDHGNRKKQQLGAMRDDTEATTARQ